MEFTTHNDYPINVIGTCFRGTIDVDYFTLVKWFGEPLEGDGEKVDAEWQLEFSDGTVATIYNWKTERDMVHFVDRWHIGGYSGRAVDRITELFEPLKCPRCGLDTSAEGESTFHCIECGSYIYLDMGV